jgi:hypothetical protein
MSHVAVMVGMVSLLAWRVASLYGTTRLQPSTAGRLIQNKASAAVTAAADVLRTVEAVGAATGADAVGPKAPSPLT